MSKELEQHLQSAKVGDRAWIRNHVASLEHTVRLMKAYSDADKQTMAYRQALLNDLRTELEAQSTRIEDLETQLELALEHDVQPYPTVEAYELACATREKFRAENESLKEQLQWSLKNEEQYKKALRPIQERAMDEMVAEGERLGVYDEFIRKCSEPAEIVYPGNDEVQRTVYCKKCLHDIVSRVPNG